MKRLAIPLVILAVLGVGLWLYSRPRTPLSEASIGTACTSTVQAVHHQGRS